jgi:hypothetical protein
MPLTADEIAENMVAVYLGGAVEHVLAAHG